MKAKIQNKPTKRTSLAVTFYNRASMHSETILPSPVFVMLPKANIGSLDAKCPNFELGFLHLYDLKPTGEEIENFINTLRVAGTHRIFMSAVYISNPHGSKTKSEYISEIASKFKSLIDAGFVNVSPLMDEKQDLTCIPFVCVDETSNLILKMDKLTQVIDMEAKKLAWDINDPSTYTYISRFNYKE